MALAICDQCQKESTFFDLYAGMRLKCNLCPSGFVNIPPKEGAVYSRPAPTVAVETAPVPAPKTAAVPLRPVRDLVEPTREADLPEVVTVLIGEGNSSEQWKYFIIFDLLVFGIGSVFLNLFGLQFTCLMFLEPLQPFAGIIMAAVGLCWLISKTTKSRWP